MNHPKKRAYIFQGGWEGHKPRESSEIIREELEKLNVEVVIHDHLDGLNDKDFLLSFNLIVPMWTMGAIDDEQEKNLCETIKSGVGLGGYHGFMGDAFRGKIDYEWMVGGHFLGHPHVGDYTVQVIDKNHPSTDELPTTVNYNSEQYYMAMDPAVRVLAKTVYKHEGQDISMPVIWTKSYGKGNVYYNALGHDPEEFQKHPYVLESIIKGLSWAGNII